MHAHTSRFMTRTHTFTSDNIRAADTNSKQYRQKNQRLRIRKVKGFSIVVTQNRHHNLLKCYVDTFYIRIRSIRFIDYYDWTNAHNHSAWHHILRSSLQHNFLYEFGDFLKFDEYPYLMQPNINHFRSKSVLGFQFFFSVHT